MRSRINKRREHVVPNVLEREAPPAPASLKQCRRELGQLRSEIELLTRSLELEKATVAALEQKLKGVQQSYAGQIVFELAEAKDQVASLERELGEARTRLTDIVREKIESTREKREPQKRRRRHRKLRRSRRILRCRDAFTVTARCLKLIGRLPWGERSRVISALTAVRDTTLPQVPSRPWTPEADEPSAPWLFAKDPCSQCGGLRFATSSDDLCIKCRAEKVRAAADEDAAEDTKETPPDAPQGVRTTRTDSWIVCQCGRSISVSIAPPLRENRQCKCGLVWEYSGDRNWAKPSDPEELEPDDVEGRTNDGVLHIHLENIEENLKKFKESEK